MSVLYVGQDGADFYIYADEEGRKVIRIVTAPFPVADGDMKEAAKARQWFKEYGYFKIGNQAVFI